MQPGCRDIHSRPLSANLVNPFLEPLVVKTRAYSQPGTIDMLPGRTEQFGRRSSLKTFARTRSSCLQSQGRSLAYRRDDMAVCKFGDYLHDGPLVRAQDQDCHAARVEPTPSELVTLWERLRLLILHALLSTLLDFARFPLQVQFFQVQTCCSSVLGFLQIWVEGSADKTFKL